MFRLVKKQPGVNPPELNDDFRTAQEAWSRAQTIFGKTVEGFGRMKYRRVLGWGGFGVVLLWSVLDSEGDHIRDVATKFHFSDGRDWGLQGAQNELTYLRRYRGHEHIVQLVDLWGHVNFTDGHQFYNNPETDPAIIVMEVLEKCSAINLIERVAEARDYNRGFPHGPPQPKLEFIPNRVLWRLFRCLVRGIIGMAYPRLITLGDETVWRETVDENVEPLREIHFDIDFQNVLCGDMSHPFEDEEHSKAPILKLADFGLADKYDPASMSTYTTNVFIDRGKFTHSAPEQRDPRIAIAQSDYLGHPLNVWGVGVLMFNFMTLCHPDNDSWTFLNMPLQDQNGEVTRIDTWGWCLLANEAGLPTPFEDYDPLLCHLVARCMAHLPSQRPDLGQLLAVIEDAIRQTDSGTDSPNLARSQTEGDDLLVKFYTDYFRSPPERRDPYAAFWDQPLAPRDPSTRSDQFPSPDPIDQFQFPDPMSTNPSTRSRQLDSSIRSAQTPSLSLMDLSYGSAQLASPLDPSRSSVFFTPG
ncbi:kinase-like domain-containing protein [Hypoxylon sp. NC1633]|nr:kinase-like domain-containing protein [Hypoxylon sp. NC1633]